jgi:hypothetical protein
MIESHPLRVTFNFKRAKMLRKKAQFAGSISAGHPKDARFPHIGQILV